MHFLTAGTDLILTQWIADKLFSCILAFNVLIQCCQLPYLLYSFFTYPIHISQISYIFVQIKPFHLDTTIYIRTSHSSSVLEDITATFYKLQMHYKMEDYKFIIY